MANKKSLWLRLYTEVLNDPKVQRLDGETFKGWINLLCVAKEYSDDGILPPLADICFYLRMSESDTKYLLDMLIRANLIEITNDEYTIHAWSQRQYESDNDPTRYERVKRFREKQKEKSETEVKRVSSAFRNAKETRIETETETEKERNKKESDADASPCLPQDEPFDMASIEDPPDKPKTKRFIKPSIDDVAAYCKERGNRLDAQAFIDFYEAVGWRVGNKPMKDWRAAVRTWEHRDPARAPKPARKEKRYRLIGGMNCPICGAPLVAGHTMCDKCSARIDHGLEPTERYYESYEVEVLA